MRTGTGRCAAHHGELLQGAFADRDGVVRPGLVTLPYPGLVVRASFTPSGPGRGPVTVTPPARTKAARAARLAADVLAGPIAGPIGGRLVLTGAVPSGLGMGSSTADVVAAVRAVADACGVRPSPRDVARLAVAAEAASDPLMFDDRPRLFAHRDGDVLEELGRSLPPLLVLGCLLANGRPVDTPLVRPPSPPPDAVAAYADLRARIRRAVADRDVRLLGRVATASAERSRVGPELDLLRDVAADTGAAGVQVAHSGSVAGLLFDARDTDPATGPARAAAALRGHGVPVTGTFVPTTTPGGPQWTHTWPTPSGVPISSHSTTG